MRFLCTHSAVCFGSRAWDSMGSLESSRGFYSTIWTFKYVESTSEKSGVFWYFLSVLLPFFPVSRRAAILSFLCYLWRACMTVTIRFTFCRDGIFVSSTQEGFAFSFFLPIWLVWIIIPSLSFFSCNAYRNDSNTRRYKREIFKQLLFQGEILVLC